MEDRPASEAGKEAQFIEWMVEENRRREVERLRERLVRLEMVQLASYFMILLWVSLMFVGFRLRPDLVSAEMAGVVTAIALFGGAFVIWHILRLKREVERRIEAEQGEGPVESRE